MAEFLGVNAGFISAGQGKKGSKGEATGRLRMLFDERAFTAEYAGADTVKIGAPIPAGARVVGAVFKSPDMGGTGTVNFGYQANGVDVADPDAFVVSADNSGQAVQSTGAGDGIGRKFTVATQCELTFSGASASATGKTLQAWVFYVVD
jgi:hypothetical protein